MRKLSKILVLVLALAMMFSLASMFTVSAAQPEYLYLTPNANWKTQGARFAAYFFGNGEKWVSMTDSNKDGVYEVKVPTDKVYPNVIFCRMNPSATANNWNNKWNQTADLTISTSGANHYTVKEGTWDKGGGTWSTFGSTCAHANLGPAATCTTAQECKDCGDPVVSALGHTFNASHLCTRCNEQASFTVAGSGAHLGTEWDTGNKANDMTFADGVYTKVYTNVAAGTYAFKVARDHDWGTAYPSADKSYTVATSGSTVTITLKGTTVNVVVEAPHVHNFVEGKCECGEEDPNYVPLIPGTGTEVDPFVISSLEALIAFRDSVNAGETKYNAEGVYVVLGADIDMAEVDWSVNIGDNANATFDGIFDGQGHKILNLNSTETAQSGDGYVCTGLFGAIYGNAVIKNLTIENVSINTGDFTGNNVAAVVGFIWQGKGSIENVTVCGKIEINAPGIYGVGAIIGYSYSSNITVTGCKVVGGEGSYINAVSGAGAIAGYSDGVHVVNAEVSGLSIEGAGLVGGIFGIALGSDVNGATVSNVALTATKAEWVNGTGIAVGTIASKTITVAGVTSENVTGADTLVGSVYAEKPTTVVPSVAAMVNDVYYTTFADAFAALEEGGTITFFQTYVIGEGTTLLNNITIEAHGDFYPAIRIVDGGFVVMNNVTLNSDDYGIVLGASDGSSNGILHIYSGKFNCGTTVVSVTKGELVIRNGEFSATPYEGSYAYLLNCIDANYRDGSAAIKVIGGTFHNWNPANNAAEGEGTNFVLEGYHSIDNGDGTFTAGKHSYTAVVTAPTFDAQGYTTHTCVCGDSYVDSYVPALVAVATADGDPYATLAEALENGSEIVLLTDIELDSALVITGSYVIDLNGHTLTYTSTVMGEAMITNKGSLVINDSVGTGVINYNYIGANDASYGKGNYTISNAGTLTINGGMITIANLRQHAKYPIDNNSTTGDAILVINDGHLYNYNTSAIRMFCNSTTYKNSVTINGGLIEGYSAIWMQNPGSKTVNGDLTINGGEIRTTAAAYVNGTAELKDVSSNLYTTIDAEGGNWSESSFIALVGGTFNENVNVYYDAPANVTVGENATFNGNLYYIVPHTHNYEAVVTAPTCTAGGYTTYTCECGETYVADETAALGHDFVEGVCSRCEEKDPNYVPPCAHKDTGLDAKCDECGEYFVPASPFKLEMYQASKKQTYYFTGSMSGYYFATSTDITKAVDLYAEEVEGGYNVYFMSGSTKNYLYIELSGTHINAKFGTTKAVWYVDATYGCLTTVVNGTKYFLGTYSSYTTFGGTAYSRLTASTADVSQYVGRAVSLEEHECTNTTPTVTNPTCTAQGYTTYKCADCGISTKADYVDALGHDLVDVEGLAPTCTATGYTAYKDCSRCSYVEGKETLEKVAHTYENCVCTVCEAVLPALGQVENFDFSTQANFDAVVAGGKLVFTGSFRDNGGSFQFNTNSTIQFVAPANTTVTIVGHSAQYGVFNVYLNGVETKMEGSLTFTVTEETKVVIATGDNGASYSYIKSIALAEFVDRTIVEDTTITFGSEGNYKDSIVDFSGIQIGDNGGNNSQVKNGSFDLLLKAGSKVVIHGYPGYTSYQLNGGEAIESEYYTYIALEDTVLTVTPVSGNNYFYSIEVTLHTGITLVEAKGATCTEAGHGAYYACDCHEEALTDKGEIAALGHDYDAVVTAPTCTEAGYTTYTCGVCDDSYVGDEVEALGHSYEAVVTAPTCEEAGYTTYTCACGDTYTADEVDALGHVYFYNVCLTCYAPNPYFEYNFMVTGTNTVKVNEYHLVDTEGHGFPYQFTTFTVAEDGHYVFSSDKFIGFTIFTIEVNTEGADWTTGTGASWGEYIVGNEVDLKAGTYYVGMIYMGGLGEYQVTIEKAAEECVDHVDADTDYVCDNCGAELERPVDPDPVDPVDPVDPEEPAEEAEELGFWANLWAKILAFLNSIVEFFKNLF